ncbi:hypothetical protein B0T24DRAFT_522681 [Lasiosphaeria ovina]|uniref:FAR1 domain-containing protein n=1 Tax=Lasiosphaeria ovina TaxID=92902 RepID=A0AAE0NF79_9PEZI|nr:hypothetical protein B0T24DRAFT_522681 [Lasiosphaeria ovina]
METHANSQPRPRKRQRTRVGVSDNGNTANPGGAVAQNWPGPALAHSHSQTVRVHGDTVQGQPPGFPSQQLDRSHQVAEPDALMNGYTTQQHTQYPDPPTSLAATPQPDPSGLNNLNTLAGDNSGQHLQHPHPHPHHPQQGASAGAGTTKADRVIFQQYGNSPSGNATSPTTVASSTSNPAYNLPVWQVTGPTPSSTAMPPQSPAPGLAPPPEGIFRSFEDLLASIQRVAKDQGYGIVKLRASNYRDGKPTRYDLVCDRGGVKYSSTAKKRNPSTRKVDCPWRAKAVCEVNLGNQWHFAVQEGRHNHEPRIPAAVPGQENTPVAQSIRSLTNKIDRMSHEMTQGFTRMEAMLNQRFDTIEKRIEVLEGGRPSMLSGNGVSAMGAQSMPAANMGGGNLGSGPLTNGGMGAGAIVDNRLSNIEARVNAMEQRGHGMEGLPMMDDGSDRLMMVSS